MPDELLDAIRVANCEFKEFIEEVRQGGTTIVAVERAARRLENVDIRLKQVSAYLAARPRSPNRAPEAAHEIQKYRENLTSLRSVLETLKSLLLAEKNRLETAKLNFQAARAWATSIREIS
jgi:uncharacterized membrane protein YccC